MQPLAKVRNFMPLINLAIMAKDSDGKILKINTHIAQEKGLTPKVKPSKQRSNFR